MGQIMFFLNRNCDHFDIDWINILHRQIWTSSVHLFPCWSDGNFLTSQFQTVTKRKPSPHFGKKPNQIPNWRHECAWTKPALTYKHLETHSYNNWHWRPHWSIMSIFSNKATTNNLIKVKPQHSLMHWHQVPNEYPVCAQVGATGELASAGFFGTQ